MNFLNPAFLFGLIAAALPIILHILNLRRLKTIEFSSLQFLKEMQKNKIRRIKLKQILLLIIRTLLVICIVLAFSRPVIDSHISGLESYSKSSNIILIDNSFSLDLSDEHGNRFNQCKRAVNDIIANLHEGDEVVLMQMASPTDSKIYEWTRSIDAIKEELSKLNISYRPADIDKNLKIAEKLLTESHNFSKNIFIVSDGQPNIFTQTEIDKLVLNHTNIYFVPVSSTTAINNLSIDSLNVISQIFQVNKAVEVETTIQNSSEVDAKTATMELSFNESKVAQRTFDVEKQAIRSVAIGAVPMSTGIVNASVELENDAFTDDNKRYFGFIIPDKPTVALFSDEPVAADFVNTAISLADLSQVSRYVSNQLASVNLSQFDMAIVNTGNYSSSDFDLLKQYVINGGSVLVFANDKTAKNVMTNALATLGFGNTKLVEYSKTQPNQFTSTDKVHPLFDGVFKIDNNSRGVIESPKIYKATPAVAGQNIIEMGGGAFLSENILGDGKVLYCAVAPTLEWSNFPITGIFPAIMSRSVAFLGSHPEISYNFELGNNASVMIQKKYATSSNFKVIDPNGNEFLRQAALLPSGAVLDFNDMNQPGVYAIYNSNNLVVALVALNLQKSESDFTRYTSDELLDKLTQRIDTAASNTRVSILNSANDISDNINRIQLGTELWRLLVLLAILLAIAEIFVQKSSKLEATESVSDY